MRYRTLPNTDLQPSVICLGSALFGSGYTAGDSWALLDAFAEQGGNCVDTAHVYASWLPGGEGASERTIGSWLRARRVRESFIVGTKGGHPDLSTNGPPRLAPAEITHDLMESLDRLGTGYVDLYWLHRDNPAVPVGEILGVLNEHVSARRVRALGASNWGLERLQEAAAYARAHGLAGFCASQVGWSLAWPDPAKVDPTVVYMDERALAYHRQTQMPVFAFSSQACGFFSGRYMSQGSAPAGPQANADVAPYLNERNWRRLERVKRMAGAHGWSMNQVALAYLLNQPFPAYPIVGCRTVAQVVDSCGSADVQLSSEELRILDGA